MARRKLIVGISFDKWHKDNLYPSWEAQNMNSVHLAMKLGYEFDHEYVAYEVDHVRKKH